jgi:AraC family transcriptional regulator of adaptative response/methylated-DNA-[protein]-cysteine methyltransferase
MPTIEHTSADYQLVAEAIHYLEANHTEQPSLEELATYLHLSPFHLQRVFKRWAGISPKRFLQFLTVEHAKQLLAASHSVMDTAYAAGLSGPSRLHDHFLAIESMTPGEFKEGGRGLTIAYGVHASPFGDCLLALTERGVCHLSFLNGGGRDSEIMALHERWPHAKLVENAKVTGATLAHIFPGEEQAAGAEWLAASSSLRLLLAGTNFQVKVWEALLRIPPGAVTTYEDVAHAIGKPSAARAVGGAVGANAIAYLIPCHRVIRKSGVIQDYRWGPTRKKAILGWEAAHMSREQ